jgi:hypothetical protein
LNACEKFSLRSEAVKQKADHKAGLIAVLPHNQRSGHREEKVAHVVRRLNQPRLEACNLERLHELLDQDVVHAAGNAPEEEERRDEEKRQSVTRSEQARSAAGGLKLARFRP